MIPENAAEILVVDDNPLIGQLLVGMLDQEGYRAASVASSTVVACAVDAPPRLILLDVLMPGSDGPTLCRQLRADPRTRAVPLVFVTGLPRAALDELLRDCPHDDVLPKPFDLEALLTIVERHVGSPAPEA